MTRHSGIERWAGRVAQAAAGAAALAGIGGCVVVEPDPPVTVELVNETALVVTPRLFTSDQIINSADLYASANVFTNYGDRIFPELASRESVTLEFDCENVARLGVNDALRFDPIGLVLTESEDAHFLRRGVDFDCGSTVRFFYSSDVESGDFRVRVEVD